MTVFVASKYFEVPTRRHYRRLTLDKQGMTRKFWRSPGAHKYRKRRGCYIFGIKHGNRIVPTYVGKATKSFGQEIFQSHKRVDHYIPALRRRRNGVAAIIFLAHRYKKKPNISSIDKLETQLIQQAVRKKLELTNLRKTYLRELRIQAVFDFKKGRKPQGKANGTAMTLRRMFKF